MNTPRGILLGGAHAGVSASAALAEFHKLYPGKSADIEQAIVHDWSKDPWADMCERTAYQPGQLSAGSWAERLVPAGAFISPAISAQMSRGQELLLESANRAAREIDQA